MMRDLPKRSQDRLQLSMLFSEAFAAVMAEDCGPGSGAKTFSIGRFMSMEARRGTY